PRTLRSPLLLERLSAAGPGDVVLEVAEAQALQRFRQLQATLPSVRALGVRLAIDAMQWNPEDGPRLLSLGPDFVKIEMGLCHYIHLDRAREDEVRALVDAAEGAAAVPIAVGLQA